MKKSISIIGSGFSSLSAACYLAKMGHHVSVFEKNEEFGGRARQFKEDGFTFDMGPSWYWMPDVFEKFFNDFNKETKDFYELKKLNPPPPPYILVYKILLQYQTHWKKFVKFLKKKKKGAQNDLKNLFLKQKKIIKLQ